ncbi:OmpA family protein, partial [Streptomyces griseorubiginosus]|nr:OmpA family protein [Streptomyces griseorubiginosus]
MTTTPRLPLVVAAAALMVATNLAGVVTAHADDSPTTAPDT